MDSSLSCMTNRKMRTVLRQCSGLIRETVRFCEKNSPLTLAARRTKGN